MTVTPLIQNEYLDAEREWFVAFTRSTGIQVRIVPTLESTTDRLGQYRRFFNAHSPEPDVLTVDVIWPGLLAEDLVDLRPSLGGEMGAHIPELVRNSTVRGRLVGAPITFDVGMLYYRTDLLKEYGFAAPPRTWPELERMAAVIQAGERRKGKSDFWGYIWQGAPYEGLTCNALEWQVAYRGGRILDDSGIITVNNPGAIAALEQAAQWIGRISPRSVLGYREEDARNVWESGNAAFMRNWQYAYRLGMDPRTHLRDRMAIAPLPGGGTLGGAALAVSRYSMHQKEALAFVRYFSGLKRQQERWAAIAGVPTIPALLQAPEGRNPINPMHIDHILERGTLARPSAIAAGNYDRVSRTYFTTVHAVLSGEKKAGEALAALERDLAAIPGLQLRAPADAK